MEKVYKLFKYKVIGEKWNYHEDNIWSILLHKFANTSMFVNKKIYYYYNNSDSEMFNRGNSLELLNLLYRNEMYRKIFKKKEEEKYIIAGYLELIKIFDKYNEIIIKNKDVKSKCLKELNDFISKFNLSEEIIKTTKDLISKSS